MTEQYFLTNPEKLRVLVEAARIESHTRVLELGAGGGTVAAALPRCTLTLVELDATLTERLRQRFPNAAVLQEDALAALERLEFDVLLSNLPHALTLGVLERLREKHFQRALVAIHERDDLDTLEARSGCAVTSLGILGESDFSPPQPFKSKLILVTPKLKT
jgi:16S rRNA A1518/A1519 N6-dimethyltransferase RsmA/KsgA/DIM1 with predicted DNA glycosylase/AP lyase activity